jgi:hypothetical protein
MKRFVVFFIIAILCILLGLWSPWLYFDINLKPLVGLKESEKISGMQVFSLSGEMEVFVNDESKGKVTPENSPLVVDRINPGENLVGVKKTNEFKESYWQFSKIINFETGTDVILSYDLGPTSSFSEGHIIYAVEKVDKEKTTQLNISTNIDGAKVQIDNLPAVQVQDQKIAQGISLDNRHKIVVSKSGFETLEFTILPERQEDRDIFKNFDINVEVQLMYQPVTVE